MKHFQVEAETTSDSPTKARIHTLEQEISRLKSQLAENDPRAASTVSEGVELLSANAIDQDQAAPQQEVQITTENDSNRNSLEPQAENTYYGTTSTLFNADHDSLQSTTQPTRRQRVASPASVQNSLVAAAAKQSESLFTEVLDVRLTPKRTTGSNQL